MACFASLKVRFATFVCLFAAIGILADGAANQAAARDRSLTVHNTHTGETRTITFKRNGRYIDSGLRELNRFARDWRRNESTKMDPKLFDLIWEVYREVGARKPVHVVSGYRSPATNEMLRSRSRGVAKNSRHTKGQAMDFYIPGVSISKLREAAMKKQVGGVGYYPRSRSPFVHLDTGNVRAWPRMTRSQLLALFPDGKTLHLPSDGKPLQGYQQALAARKSGTLAQLSNDSGGGGFNLFGGRRKRDDDDPRRTRVASSTKPLTSGETATSRTTSSRNTAASASDNARSNDGGNNGINLPLPGRKLIAGLFNDNDEDSEDGNDDNARVVASAPTPPANVSSVPGVSSALPVDAQTPTFSEPETPEINAVPRARPKAVIELAAAIKAEEAPSEETQTADGVETPDDIPFQVASADTLQALNNGQNLAGRELGIVAANALTSASENRLRAIDGLFKNDEAGAGVQTAAAQSADAQGVEAVSFVPRSRPDEYGAAAADGIDPTITSKSNPAGRPGVTNVRQALAFQAGNSEGTAVVASNDAGVPSAVLAYAGLNDDLPPIPEPASAADALPRQSLTLPVSATATASISAEEIAEIFAGGRNDAADTDVGSAAALAPGKASEQAGAISRQDRIVSRLLTVDLTQEAELIHPDQRSITDLLSPRDLVSDAAFVRKDRRHADASGFAHRRLWW